MVGFALLLAVVLVAGRALGETFGASGAIAGAAIAGLFDVDAITVSMARLAPRPLDTQSAALAIIVAAATDTLSKVAIGASLGARRFALELAAMALACFLAGGIALWLTFALLQI